MRRAAILIGAVLAVGGCGKEVGRIPFAAEGTATATVPLAAGEVAFWTDLDAEWDGDGAFGYQVALEQNGATVATATCNPLGTLHVKTSWVATNLGGHHSRRGNGKMSCGVKVAQGGPTTVTARLSFEQRPPKLALRRADLVLRQ